MTNIEEMAKKSSTTFVKMKGYDDVKVDSGETTNDQTTGAGGMTPMKKASLERIIQQYKLKDKQAKAATPTQEGDTQGDGTQQLDKMTGTTQAEDRSPEAIALGNKSGVTTPRNKSGVTTPRNKSGVTTPTRSISKTPAKTPSKSTIRSVATSKTLSPNTQQEEEGKKKTSMSGSGGKKDPPEQEKTRNTEKEEKEKKQKCCCVL